MKIITAKKENLKIILKGLKSGKVLIFPTDTVYGLICDAENKKAVNKIFKIKERDKSKPLAVFVKNIVAAKKIVHINKKQERFLKNNKLTVILKAKKPYKLSPLVYKKGTIGIRMPDYEVLNSILEKFKKPIAQTSANISGRMATTKIKEVLEQFKNQKVGPDLTIDAGDLPKNKPSKVVDLTKKQLKILRK
ncbi:threonylcarbamoyl-AMP synthase [Patescibacteria group bacterium]|nr:threonylcarbamoyl-AMP synthase [Patescibacteria group bacterium]MBU4367432.1 threonylcarbamoyl-AMP synthase [Patescibacteria group bacterium]MBU4461752.1 threonylcarbamoyl-AMP synthase [Patescibacteria group bacterium]MCG2700136.1 threonylcarbamoyl-AMP synthase [Candidatus Parcubacteria bacterium]